MTLPGRLERKEAFLVPRGFVLDKNSFLGILEQRDFRTKEVPLPMLAKGFSEGVLEKDIPEDDVPVVIIRELSAHEIDKWDDDNERWNDASGPAKTAIGSKMVRLTCMSLFDPKANKGTGANWFPSVEEGMKELGTNQRFPQSAQRRIAD